jgi:NADH-quinone oxidoreductase subunit N
VILAVLAQAADHIDRPPVEWSAIAPPLVLVGGALLLLLVGSLMRPRVPWVYAFITVVTGIAAMAVAVPLWIRVQDGDRGPFSAMAGAVGIDGFSVFLAFLISAAVVLAALISEGYLRREHTEGPEVYVLLLLSAAGGLVMASANDLIVMFLGLEILSIAVYVLAALNRRRLESQEAGLKYFVLGAFSSAFFLYGIALVYGATGTTNMVKMARFLSTNLLEHNGLMVAGIALLLVGFGFKIAAVPFHTWTPDVYQGSPSPVVSYMASGVKAAGFAGLLRVFFLAFHTYSVDWQPFIYALAIATLVVGAVLAVVQTDVKRMLAYSSISHAGFILVGVEAASTQGVSSVLFYLAAYTFMVVGSFGVAAVVGGRGDARQTLDDYRGLSRRRPVLAFAFTVFLLAQAGVPLTVGFLAKFYVIAAAVQARSFPLAIVAMVSAVIAAFLYLRVIVSMYVFAPSEDGEDAAVAPAPRMSVPAGATIALGLAFAFTVVFGIIPGPMTNLAHDATPHLVATSAP